MRAEERTCLFRTHVNQQLAGSSEEREGWREAVLAGRWSMSDSKQPRMASAVLSGWVKHDGKMERSKKEILQKLSQMSKPAKYTFAHTQSQAVICSLNLSLSYIQRAGPADP